MRNLTAEPVLPAPRSSALHDCPLNHGLAVVDQLLAAIFRENDIAAVDAVLDFRLLLAGGEHEPDAVIRGFFCLRNAVEERHYLSCFRLRRWLESKFVARVHLDRQQPAQHVRLRLDVSGYAELCAGCARDASNGDTVGPWTRVQFAEVTGRVPVA